MKSIFICLNFLLAVSCLSDSARNQIQLETKATSKVLVPIADGFEDIEVVTIVDVLRRAGADVITASLSNSKHVIGMMKTQITTEEFLSNVLSADYDLIVLPGGGANAKTLASSDALIKKLKSQKTSGKWYAAICASPAIVFAPNGLLDGVKATSFPGMDSYFEAAGTTRANQRVVVSKNCITSQSPGTALEFAIELVKNVISQEKGNNLAENLGACSNN